MELHFSSRIVLLTIQIVLAPVMLSAQYARSSTAWLKISDSAGGHDSLVFGNQLTATYCVDTVLGENYSPPRPPQGLWAVFMSIPGRANCFGTLGIIGPDLRPFKSAFVSFLDTFDIDFLNGDSIAQSPGAFAILRWPTSEVLQYDFCDSMLMVDRMGGTLIPSRIDMFSQDSVRLLQPYDTLPLSPSDPIAKIRIFKYTRLHEAGIGAEDRPVPNEYFLSQNFPNPFNPTTNISYSLPHRSHVSLSVYNLLGMKVQTLFEGDELPGLHNIVFDGASLASGMYYYRLQAGDFTEAKKLLLIR
jgi:hypothetical protein